jgi:hypothetical protein
MARPVSERHQARAARLATLQRRDSRGHTIDELARKAREKLWAARGSGDPEVLLRAGLLLRDEHPKSPLLDVSAPRSAAVQLLLVALFAEQCRRPRAAGQPTQLPLRDPTEVNSTSWRYLVALPALDSGGRRTAGRNPTDNRLEQLRTALTRLHRCGRIQLRSETGRGRFERFRLLNESTYKPGETVPYTWPTPEEIVVRVPAEFFLNGWAHALTDNEIAAFLYLLLCQQHNQPDLEIGVPVPRADWATAFGTDRAHIGYRMLSRFGLVQIFRQAVRRDDGTLEGFNDGDFPYIPDEPLRFIVDTDTLQMDALGQVIPALESATSTRLDEASDASRGAS